MKTLSRILLFVPLFAFLFISCSEDDPPPEEILEKVGDFPISELAGSWDATIARFSDDIHNIEVIGEGGSISMTVQSNGRFAMTINPANRSSYNASGEMFWEKWEGRYYFAIVWDDDPSDWETYGATLTETTLNISGGNMGAGEYDFDNDGTFEPCRVNLSFVRS